MNKWKQVILHTCVWASILIFFMYLATDGKIVFSTIVLFVYFGIVNILVFYTNYLLILPNFLNQGRYVWCAFTMVLLMIASAFIKSGLAYYFYDIVIKRNGVLKIIDFWDYFSSAAFVSGFFITISTILKFILDWFLNEKVKNHLENEKLIAELAFLKSQINPHFLFNSLNNIYSLAYQKAEKTPEAILKLSEIMRYMLYESNIDKVSLADEIRYLNNYIELQKLRFKDDIHLEFKVIGNPVGHRITPLILISFVENAFKHGIVNDLEIPISITLSISDEALFFHVFNKKTVMNKDSTGGIGLPNVKRRLELLYKNRYSLTIDDKNDTYRCELNLIL